MAVVGGELRVGFPELGWVALRVLRGFCFSKLMLLILIYSRLCCGCEEVRSVLHRTLLAWGSIN